MAENTTSKFPTHVPHRIKAANDFLNYCYFTENPLVDSSISKGRELTEQENLVKKSVLNLLNNYFLGEIDLGDCPQNYQYPETTKEETKKSKKEKKKRKDEVEV